MPSLHDDQPLLEIENLTVAYRRGDQWVDAIRGVSMHIRRGEIYGLVGESGSGKTTLALAILRYLGSNARIREGRIALNGRELTYLTTTQMQELWGKSITLVPQNPQSALNPSMRIGDQVIETLQYRHGSGNHYVHQSAVDWLGWLKITDPQRVFSSYPHQISGGMQQRVLIAMALISEPELLILDEPTTSLDATTQAEILELVQVLIRQRDTSVLYVTHNLGVVAEICDRVGVLYAGELVEEGSTPQIFSLPLHPYTQGLIDSLPRLGERKDRGRLRAIPGQIPSMHIIPAGCIFRPRCPLAVEICRTRPPLLSLTEGRRSRCHRWKEIQDGTIQAHQPISIDTVRAGNPTRQEEICLTTTDLRVHFPAHPPFPMQFIRRSTRAVRALDQVSLDLRRGTTLGLVGESGSGKTTLARAVMGLVERTGGSVSLLGFTLPPDLSQRSLGTLRMLQMVFQNPEEALNPYFTVGEILSRPLMRLLRLSRQAAAERVIELLRAVRLTADYAHRYPHQLSGGELQRIAIARALAANPELVVYDEPLSALDVSVQAAMLNLISDLQDERNSSLLFISHDLAIVTYLADQVAIIYLGQLMEISASSCIFTPPFHPYTEALFKAVPVPDPKMRGQKILLAGEPPSPRNPPEGCPFHTRCPRVLGAICRERTPPWQEVPGMDKRIFCHIPFDRLVAEQDPLPTPFTGTHP